MELKRMIVLTRRSGCDLVYIETDLPEATYPYKEHLDLQFEAAAGTGVDYVKRHFPDAPIDVISMDGDSLPASFNKVR